MDEIQTVEITKRPGQSLGFYIREGNGRDRTNGVFISRLAAGGVAELNGLLKVGDEILSVNTVPVSGRRLDDVVISMSVSRRLLLNIRPSPALSSETNSSSSLSGLGATDDDDAASTSTPVVVVRSGSRGSTSADELTRYTNGYRPDDVVDSGLSSDTSTLHRPQVPWSGNPADRGKLNHVRRPDQQFQTSTSTLHHSNYCSDAEMDFAPPGDGQRCGWGMGQRVCVGPPGAERRVQEWTERNMALYLPSGPTSDYYTLGARRQHRGIYNGAINTPNTTLAADNAIPAANVNRWSSHQLTHINSSNEFYGTTLPYQCNNRPMNGNYRAGQQYPTSCCKDSNGFSQAASVSGYNADNNATLRPGDQHISRANDVTWMTSRPNLGPSVRPPPRLTRKMSVDCLLDHYNDSIDQLETTKIPGYRPSRPMTLARRSPSGYFTGTGSGGTMTSSRSASVDSCGYRNLARPPLQLRTDLFRHYPSSVPTTTVPSASVLEGGLLSVHVYCGRGLASAGSRAALQELYCVVAVDGVSRARTGVNSGATTFDWDDRFLVDLNSSSAVSFAIYSFDRRAGRHRLCFTASVSLPAVIRRGGEADCRERLAVKLDPRGVLYVELAHRTPPDAFRRRPAVDVDAVFGSSLTGTGETPDVAILVRRCVEEVEHRGALEQSGIYRLCGSSKRASRLRDELETQGPQGVNLSQSAVGDINVITG